MGAALLLIALRLVLHNWLRAALVTTLLLALFFSYGHMYNFLEQSALLAGALGRHRILIPAWLILLGTGLWWAARPGRDLPSVTSSLNLIAAIAVVLPLAQMGISEARALRASPVAGAASQSAGPVESLHLPAGQPAPDIYYIILDGYSRDDMLRKFYQWDNTPFLEQLDQMGFAVSRCSQSNYAQTQLSLASSLNFNYLDALGDHYTAGNTSRAGLADLIQHSAARRALESLGYKVVAFETGFEATQLVDADVYLSSGASQGIEDFENLLIRTTAARILAEGVASLNLKPDWEARDQAHRQRILYTLDELRQMPNLAGPKFVFAHIVIPHWPHVFGPNGEPVHERQDSLSGYRNQVIFINKQIVPILADIIARSNTPPVIVVQGDHGAVIESPERRMAILNAYYLPGDGGQLYENISPVNTFRLIFNAYFGGKAPFLKDIAEYSTYEDPYRFQVVPNERPGCTNP